MSNFFDMRCPNCGGKDQIDIQALVWIRLCEDGTDAAASQDGDQHCPPKSPAACVACGHRDTVRSFEPAGGAA
jgi:ribosomal protein S27E